MDAFIAGSEGSSNQPLPYRAGLAAPGPKRLRTITAFSTGSFPLQLSPPGRLSDPEVVSSELLLSARGIKQRVKWRTSSA
jgi:hypothetical protein